MKKYEELTLQELEELSRAYLDCRLSRTEEKELELLLYTFGASSPVIREARASMGIETLIAASPVRLKRRPWLRWIAGVAACAMALLGIAITVRLIPREPEPEAYVCVIVDGRVLSPGEAERTAAEIQSHSLAMLNEALTAINAEEAYSLGEMNEIMHGL